MVHSLLVAFSRAEYTTAEIKEFLELKMPYLLGTFKSCVKRFSAQQKYNCVLGEKTCRPNRSRQISFKYESAPMHLVGLIPSITRHFDNAYSEDDVRIICETDILKALRYLVRPEN